MSLTTELEQRSLTNDQVGERMHALLTDLFPLPRSITGAGLRATLDRIGEEIPLEIQEVNSGTQVFDFTIPLEWKLRDAYVADASGQRVIDYRASNLHVVSDSQGVRKRCKWRELEPHLHSLPDRPDWIPYRTSFFQESWGFCLTDHHRQSLAARGADELVDVCIDAEFAPGSLTYGQCVLPGRSREEVLISAHSCHPSLANDNLSAIVVAVELAKELARRADRRFTYRFLFAPATLGAIAWLAEHPACADRVRWGLVLAQLGDAGPLTYKRSRRGNAEIDRLVVRLLRSRTEPCQIREFEPWGYDERQFCSPGSDLPLGRLTRTPPGEYPQYHTSGDDLDFIQPDSLAGSLAFLRELVEQIETGRYFERVAPHGEPQLGRRGLYKAYAEANPDPRFQQAVLWVLNQADGRHSLVDIAERSGLAAENLTAAAEVLLEQGLLREWLEVRKKT